MRKEINKGFALCNVVWYDGKYAYVSKFVLEVDINEMEITPLAECLIEDYLADGGEVLKVDPLYGVDLFSILALKDSENCDLRTAFRRFNEMYF